VRGAAWDRRRFEEATLVVADEVELVPRAGGAAGTGAVAAVLDRAASPTDVYVGEAFDLDAAVWVDLDDFDGAATLQTAGQAGVSALEPPAGQLVDEPASDDGVIDIDREWVSPVDGAVDAASKVPGLVGQEAVEDL
jgi:hypothetical protein